MNLMLHLELVWPQIFKEKKEVKFYKDFLDIQSTTTLMFIGYDEK